MLNIIHVFNEASRLTNENTISLPGCVVNLKKTHNSEYPWSKVKLGIYNTHILYQGDQI